MGRLITLMTSTPFCAKEPNSALITSTARRSLNFMRVHLFRNSHTAIYTQEMSSSINTEKYFLSSTGIVRAGGQNIGSIQSPSSSLLEYHRNRPMLSSGQQVIMNFIIGRRGVFGFAMNFQVAENDS